MTLAELIAQTTWPEARAALRWNYDDAKEPIGRYRKIFVQPWEEWLASEIDEATQTGFTGPEIVAHCIWDMTFHGFEQVQIQEELEFIYSVGSN